jgi:hypothetical protein
LSRMRERRSAPTQPTQVGQWKIYALTHVVCQASFKDTQRRNRNHGDVSCLTHRKNDFALPTCHLWAVCRRGLRESEGGKLNGLFPQVNRPTNGKVGGGRWIWRAGPVCQRGGRGN